MKRFGLVCGCASALVSFSLLAGDAAFAEGKGPPIEMIRNAYRQILAGADKNGDGKLTLAECMAISRDKAKIEKNCKYWDANGDGVITEDEYVQQARRIMR